MTMRWSKSRWIRLIHWDMVLFSKACFVANFLCASYVMVFWFAVCFRICDNNVKLLKVGKM